jgi:hypothetical protein
MASRTAPAPANGTVQEDSQDVVYSNGQMEINRRDGFFS